MKIHTSDYFATARGRSFLTARLCIPTQYDTADNSRKEKKLFCDSGYVRNWSGMAIETSISLPGHNSRYVPYPLLKLISNCFCRFQMVLNLIAMAFHGSAPCLFNRTGKFWPRSYTRWESYQLTGRKWKQASTTGPEDILFTVFMTI